MILLLVAGNVPGTLQFAARFPLHLVANEHGKSGRGFAKRRATEDYGADNG
jgi:hypothetical protein